MDRLITRLLVPFQWVHLPAKASEIIKLPVESRSSNPPWLVVVRHFLSLDSRRSLSTATTIQCSTQDRVHIFLQRVFEVWNIVGVETIECKNCLACPYQDSDSACQ